jgi:hypothetical protein
MKTILFCLTVIAALLTIACPKDGPNLNLSDSNYKKILVRQLKDNVFAKEWTEYKCANDGFYHVGAVNMGFQSFSCGTMAKDENVARNIRNEVGDNAVGLIDSVYSVYIRDFRSRRSIGEFTADVVGLGAAATSSFVHGERVVHILGASLTAFAGGRRSAQLNFYDDQTTSIVSKQMDASRSQILAEIKQNQRKSTADYSFDACLDDIIRYFDAGTLNRAFTDLDKQTSLQSEVARKGVLEIKGLSDVSAPQTAENSNVTKASFDSLAKLQNDAKDPLKTAAAKAILKSIYDQIAAEPKFNQIIADLRAKQMPQYGELSITTTHNVESAFAKLFPVAGPATEPTAAEYHSLILAVKSMTNIDSGHGVVDQPDLRKLLLEFMEKAVLK